MTEKGNATFLVIIVLLLVTHLFAKFILNQLKILENEKQSFEVALCSKEINGKTTQLIQSINRSNLTLKLLKLGKWASVLIPGLNIKTQLAAKTAEKILKRAQIMQIQSHRLSVIHMRKNGCLFSPNADLSPFRVYLTRASRNKFNEITRKDIKKWTIKYFSKNTLIKTHFQKDGKSRSQGISKGIFLP